MRKSNTADFIEKATIVHGGKYDYSNSDYKSSSTPTIIICAEHGEFHQTPNKHLSGQGCPKCSNKNITTQEFINKAKKIHGDKYDYSKVIYTTSKAKISLCCQKHGLFLITPNLHLNGSGCPKCGIVTKSIKQTFTTQEFINKANKIHNFKYNYEKTAYKTMHIKVIIICPEHGSFTQKPFAHIQGQGCPECGKTKKGLGRRITKDIFLKRAKQIHNDFYLYDKSKINGGYFKTTITSPKHDDFTQLVENHLMGEEYLECGYDTMKNKQNLGLNGFIEKARKIHGELYDYSKVEYKNSKTKVCVICQKHGQFWITPNNHINQKSGCQKCSGNTMNQEYFIECSKKLHGCEKYDYSKVKYTTSKEKICIICPEHGEFWQIPNAHLMGHGCPKCGFINGSKKRQQTQTHFITQSNIVHSNKYDYSKVEYKGSHTKVCIICPTHGEFWQKPYCHLQGRGCKKCAIEYTTKKIKLTNDNFTTKSSIIHEDKYNYSKVEYSNLDNKVCIICPTHGEFWQTPDGHLQGKGCKKCADSACSSKDEKELGKFITSIYDGRVETSNRTALGGKNEIDIYLPDIKLGIEYHGLYWHSELNKDGTMYHLNKTNAAEKQGIKLIQIFEDEWLEKKEIVKSMLSNVLNLNNTTVYARKCTIKEINSEEANVFLDNNHIQGSVKSIIRLGLYNEKDELVSIMCFSNARGCTIKSGKWLLSRFCSKLNTNVVGGASKLFKHFLKAYNPLSISSYADRRWSQGKLYETLGFRFTGNSKPSYYYLVNRKREYKTKYKKLALIKQGFNPSLSEHEIMLSRGIYRIYDCGTKGYIYYNQSPP